MNRVRVELIPAIGAGLVGLGMSALLGGAHGLRRMAEGMIWGEPQSSHRPGCHCGSMQARHHYRYHCQPRCYDCRD